MQNRMHYELYVFTLVLRAAESGYFPESINHPIYNNAQSAKIYQQRFINFQRTCRCLPAVFHPFSCFPWLALPTGAALPYRTSISVPVSKVWGELVQELSLPTPEFRSNNYPLFKCID